MRSRGGAEGRPSTASSGWSGAPALLALLFFGPALLLGGAPRDGGDPPGGHRRARRPDRGALRPDPVAGWIWWRRPLRGRLAAWLNLVAMVLAIVATILVHPLVTGCVERERPMELFLVGIDHHFAPLEVRECLAVPKERRDDAARSPCTRRRGRTRRSSSPRATARSSTSRAACPTEANSRSRPSPASCRAPRIPTRPSTACGRARPPRVTSSASRRAWSRRSSARPRSRDRSGTRTSRRSQAETAGRLLDRLARGRPSRRQARPHRDARSRRAASPTAARRPRWPARLRTRRRTARSWSSAPARWRRRRHARSRRSAAAASSSRTERWSDGQALADELPRRSGRRPRRGRRSCLAAGAHRRPGGRRASRFAATGRREGAAPTAGSARSSSTSACRVTPRPAIAELPGVFLYHLDALEELVAGALAQRREAVPDVEAILAEEYGEFRAWQRTLGALPAIHSMNEWAEQIRQRELSYLPETVNGEVREAVEKLTRRLVKKILARPTSRVVRGHGEGRSLPAHRRTTCAASSGSRRAPRRDARADESAKE